MHQDISAVILQNVLQIGHLDYFKTIEGLISLTSSSSAQFFEPLYLNSQYFVCKFSNDVKFVQNEILPYDSLPVDQYPIYHKNTILAIISLDRQENFDSLLNDQQKRIHDSICIGLILGNLKDTNYSFITSLCNELSQIVTKIFKVFSTLSLDKKDKENYELVNSCLRDVITIIYDTIDYVEIDAERVIMEKNQVSVKNFIDETLKILGKSTMLKDIDDTIPEQILLDEKHVRQILVSILAKLSDIPDLRLNVTCVDYSTIESFDMLLVLHIASNSSRNNIEINKRFQIENVSVHTLNVFIVKRLCEIMKGTFDVNENGVTIKIKIDVPEWNTKFKDKRILIGVKDVGVQKGIVNIFQDLQSNVVSIATIAHPMNLINYDMIIIDEAFSDLIKITRLQKRDTPIVAIINNNIDPTYSYIVTQTNTYLTIPISLQEVKTKCEGLL